MDTPAEKNTCGTIRRWCWYLFDDKKMFRTHTLCLCRALREALMSVTEGSGVYAVIAPNMGKQIVALQVCNHETVCRPYVAGRQESYVVPFVCPRFTCHVVQVFLL